MPTMLDLAGVQAPATVEGRSLVPFMRGESPAWREALSIEHAPWHQSMTDGKEKFIWFVDSGREQFFDLQDDPQERHDLIASPTHAPRIDLWRRRLIEHLRTRPEGFSDGTKLIPGRPFDPVLPKAAKS